MSDVRDGKEGEGSVWEWSLSLLRETNVEKKMSGILNLEREWRERRIPMMPQGMERGKCVEREEEKEEMKYLNVALPLEWPGADGVTLVDAKHVKSGSKKVTALD